MRPGPVLRPLFQVVIEPLHAFFRLEAASGILLLLSAMAALIWANSPAAASYRAIFMFPITVEAGTLSTGFTVHALVNDGLMTLFFLVVGMEIKRELVSGDLRTLGQALLPALAALGGMLVPAGLFVALNAGGPGARGWGIPMATDIAFCIGCLTLLRRRVPHALIVFVTALAIFDDIGGILVIALFYGHGIDLLWLAGAALVVAGLFAASRAGARSPLVYLVGGVVLWLALHQAGIHATLAGVAVGLLVPARSTRGPREVLQELRDHSASLLEGASDESLDRAALAGVTDRLEELEPPLDRLLDALHPWIAYGVMPVFALANSGVPLRGLGLADLIAPVPLGIALGLFAGKQIGVFLFTAAGLKLGIAARPGGAGLGKVYGVSVIAGIGFTVALFIASLAFVDDPGLLDQAKLGILVGSGASGLVGSAVLRATRRLPAQG